MGCWPHHCRSRGPGVPQLPGRGGSPAKDDGGPSRNPFASPSSRISNPRPQRDTLRHFGCRCVVVRGEGPVGSSGVCTPPHRRPLCGAVGPSAPEQNEKTRSSKHVSLRPFCVCNFRNFLPPTAVGWPPLFGPRGQVTAPYAT